MKKGFTILTFFAITFFVAGTLMAATATSNLNVSANVVAKCSIQSVTDIAFGEYDVTSSSPTDAAGDMTFKCTKGTSFKTYITGTRQMSNGTDNLTFQLYSDPGRSTVFPSDNSGSSENASSSAPITKNIYGRIPAGQDVSVGQYTDSLVITVNY
ncbi:MAG TPA: spore coat U domain-containing protein [Syntrophales bacterium]|nr:spore coat U domain-containing protein [Syntrophales bacterium]